MPADTHVRLFDRLAYLYGDEAAHTYLSEFLRVLQVYYAHKPDEMIEREGEFDPLERFSEEDVILITYGDILRGREHSPLTTLSKFCGIYLKQTINTLHILPFFPYSSDRGFSVIDFESVDPKLGEWADIEDLESRYQLMFDGVINHVSSKSRWFREFRNGNRAYEDFFISFKTPEELSEVDRKMIFRPRTGDILNRVDTLYGPRYVWTTFSPDQVDLNYKNPKVLLKIVETMLYYVRRGADILRLDAITYLWSEPGTSCIHLDQTHEVVKLFRDVLDAVASHVALITETNVPHQENISYFGTGNDEAQMVYNFALPPLVLYTFYSADATTLLGWVEKLGNPSETTHFFNFLDSHDGVGVMAVRGILSEAQIQWMVDKAASEHGALISTKARREGGEAPYEINVTWFSALNREDAGESNEQQVRRFVASRSIALALKGVPGIYLHSLFGTRNDLEGVEALESKRAINRKILDFDAIVSALEDEESKISLISRYQNHLITIRTGHRAFHPRGAQRVVVFRKEIFSIIRISPEEDEHIFCLTNVTDEEFFLEIPRSDLPVDCRKWYDLVNGRTYEVKEAALTLKFEPYRVRWLKPLSEVEG